MAKAPSSRRRFKKRRLSSARLARSPLDPPPRAEPPLDQPWRARRRRKKTAASSNSLRRYSLQRRHNMLYSAHCIDDEEASSAANARELTPSVDSARRRLSSRLRRQLHGFRILRRSLYKRRRKTELTLSVEEEASSSTQRGSSGEL